MRFSFKFLIRLYAVLVVLGIGAVTFSATSLRKQWHIEDEQQLEIDKKILEQKAMTIERSMGQIYQSLRLIALLPTIRNFNGGNQPKTTEEKFNPKFFNDETRLAVQQIYNNLAINVPVSEIYGVEKSFNPQLGEKPFFMFDELILGSSTGDSKAKEEAKSPDTPEELEDEEYTWFPSQIKSLEEQFPRFNFKALDEIPFGISSPMRTCDNSQYLSIKHGDARNAQGLSLAVPFYDGSDRLKGIIIAILRLNVLESLVSDQPFVIVTDQDKAEARKQSLRSDAKPSAFLVIGPNFTVFDRRNTSIQSDWTASKSNFLTKAMELPGGIKWELAIQKTTVQSRSGAFELILLTIVGAIIVLISFFSILALGKKLGYMKTTLENITTQIDSSSRVIQGDSSELSEEATTASGAIEQMSAAMSQFEQTVDETIKLAGQMEKSASQTKSTAESGNMEVNNAIESVHQVQEIYTSVQSVVETMKDLAFQTNLLALNAAVEAARSGEAGKGFSVVAEAVRGLAQNSGLAAQDIESKMNSAKKYIETAVNKVNVCGDALKQINTAAVQSNEYSSKLLSSLSSNKVTLRELVSGLNQLEKVNLHNAESARKLSDTSADFEAQTQNLQSSVSEIGDLID